MATTVAEWDATRARLKALLRAQDARGLAQQPLSGDWSIIENVRHLLFAEQAHLRRFVPNGAGWSPVGLSSFTRPEIRAVGTKPTKDLETVLAAWDGAHRPIRAALKRHPDAAATRLALERHLKHLNNHITGIGRMLRRFEREKRAARPPKRT